jgi:single-stranded-DNA-specific exonuclease
MVFVADERIARGITGALANKLSQHFKVPAMVLTFVTDGTAVGSVRSIKGFEITRFLDQFSDLFINYGGHDAAAGFSFTPDKLPEFTSRLERLGKLIELPDMQDSETIEIDAEIPHDYMTPDLLKLVDKFEPYGEQNPPLNFLLKNTKILQVDFMGKAEKNHLKLMLDCGKHKWPARFWNAASRLNKDFSNGDFVDSIFQMNRNIFNGVETPQIVLTDCCISDGNKK